MIDLGNLHEQADAIAKKAADKTYKKVFRDVRERLEQSKPAIDVLQQHEVTVVIDDTPASQPGIYVAIERGTAEQIFISRIERITDTYLDRGSILFPVGFAKDAYTERLEMMAKCHAILKKHKIESELIKNAEEGLAILYVPSTPA